jgi:hypothetical protein
MSEGTVLQMGTSVIRFRDLGYFPRHSTAAPGLSHVCPALGKLDDCLAGIPIAV